MFLRLALASVWSRRGSALLTFLAITVSVFVLLGVEQVRQQARTSFGSTVSGIDLIVGARTGDINLLLYSVFRLGDATGNISWQSYQRIAADPKVAWTIPISLGDSHKGYRVMGASADYFTHFRYGRDRSLAFAAGEPFSGVFDVVLGSAVARSLAYALGDQLVLAHGLGSTSFSKHDDKPFRVTGILRPTGTPVDQTLHVSLAGIEAIHLGWHNGVRLPGAPAGQQDAAEQDLSPESITAFMVGLKSRLATFQLQREITTFQPEPLSAILPGVTLSRLWQMMAVLENTLRLISSLVLLASLLGLAAMLLASIRERQREVAVLRAIGASPWFVLALIETEALIITFCGVLAASALLGLGSAMSGHFLPDQFSLLAEGARFGEAPFGYAAAVLAAAAGIALIPGLIAYRQALHQQLN